MVRPALAALMLLMAREARAMQTLQPSEGSNRFEKPDFDPMDLEDGCARKQEDLRTWNNPEATKGNKGQQWRHYEQMTLVSDQCNSLPMLRWRIPANQPALGRPQEEELKFVYIQWNNDLDLWIKKCGQATVKEGKCRYRCRAPPPQAVIVDTIAQIISGAFPLRHRKRICSVENYSQKA